MFADSTFTARYIGEQPSRETLEQLLDLLDKLSLGALFGVVAATDEDIARSEAGLRFLETRERILMRRDPQRAVEDAALIDLVLNMVGAGGG